MFKRILFILLMFACATFSSDSSSIPDNSIKTLIGQTYVTSVAFSPDGKTLASGSRDKTIKLWDVTTGQEIKTLIGHTMGVGSVAFSPDGKTLASGSDDNTIRSDNTIKLWDVTTGQEIKTLIGHTRSVASVAFSPDGKTLASGSWDDVIKLWDVTTGQVIWHTGGFHSVAFSPDGKTLASGSRGKTIKLWDVTTGQEIKTLIWHTSGIYSVAFSPDGKTLASGSWDTIKLWDVTTGQEIKTLIGHTMGVGSVAFSPDGKTLASGSRGKTIKLWDVTTGQEIKTLIGHTDSVTSVAFSPDGKTLASGSWDKTIKLWDVSSLNTYKFKPQEQSQPAQATLLPKLSFVNPPLAVDSPTAHIKVKISGESSGEELLLNGIEIAPLDTKEQKDGNTTYKIYNLPLQNGLNNISISAYDKTHTNKTEPITHTIVAKYQQKKPTLHAIIIGINEFADSRLNLRFAKNDATLVKELLEQHGKDIFNGVNIQLLVTPQTTTKEYIINSLKKYMNISPNDFFIFYSSTHGAVLDNTYYMITSNINKVTPESVKSQTLSQQDIKELFSKIPTTNKLLLFDTCYAGAVNESVASELAKLSMGRLNLTSMSAATSSQEALEGNRAQHGLFTYVLANALNGAADFNGDGVIQSMELVNYVNSNLPAEAIKYGRIQTPASFQAGQVFNVVKKDNVDASSVNMQPLYYNQQEVNNLVNAMNNNDVASFNKIKKEKEQQTSVKIQQLLNEAVINEASNASTAFNQDGQKFEIDRYRFIFNDDSVFLNIKDKLKATSAYTDEDGNNLIVFDFYSSQFTPHRINYIDTPKIRKIDIGWHDTFYRITLHTKTKQSYNYIQNESGIFIKLKNKE